ncbi:non-ribosomal peptide synthetase [Micromonospora eburnea]|uniref:Pyochelin synthetase n=1 Tax=Micromonospora eburnea TaxID=227316 RepID=A0A1C6UH35_9ACTN|nr:non-ribosomal peptide synthetase [Micromonospora eburnea]SCL53405.1 pyochelin synthetase [Micromonospora eburnea]
MSGADEGSGGVASLVADLARIDVRLKLVGADQLSVSAPKGRLSPALRERITRHRSELIGWLSRDRDAADGAVALPEITPDPADRHEPFPPSDIQMSFLVGSREGLEYHVRPHQYMEVDFPELDPTRFERALNAAARRHRHSLVVVREDMMLQTVRDPEPIPVEVIDLRERDEAGQRAGIERTRAAMQRRELPLDRWPWLDVRLSLLSGGRVRMHWNNNNFFSDAPGTGRFLKDLLHYYAHPDEPLPELTLSYRDCVLALARLEESPLGQASKKYWCDRMADWPTAPELPLAPGSDTRRRSRLERREHVLSPARWAAFTRRAAERGLSQTNALCAVYAEVLGAWSGSRHFLINNMNTHRLPLHPQIGEVIGNFSSLYPLEVDWRAGGPFHERARRLQAQVLADMQHVHWSGVKVLQAVNQLRRTPGRAVCPYAVGSALFVGQTDRPVYSLLETPQVLLDCEFWEQRDGSMWTVWDVLEAMFPPGLMDDMLAGYGAVLEALADSDEAWEREAFDLLPAVDRQRRARQNEAGAPTPPGLLHAALAERATAQPARPAVIAGDTTLSYAELYRRAGRLAAALRAAGVAPGDLVAVAGRKDWPQLVAVHAVLLAGAAYVPIDPGWPAERIGYLLADTGATAVVTGADTREALAGAVPVPLVVVEEVADDGPALEYAPLREPVDLAYVIYTSGSTGRPKGAMLDHRGPLNTVTDVNTRYGVTERDVLLGISSLCFDLSVYDVFGAAAAGATLVLPDPARHDPASWLALARDRQVTVWNSVPALMQLLVEEAETTGAGLPDLRLVLLSGDWIPVTLPDRIRAIAPNARVVSLGGATEASIWSIAHPVERVDPGWVSIPYGRPLTNQTWHVLDELGRDAPTWVPGHLYIGGVGLAMGYLNDPDRTDAAFVSHPVTRERLYRTGDRGRYLPDGTIEFLGRADFQVKIQGFRVEPGEVEHALLEHPDVGGAAVVARTSGAGRQLAAFVVGRDGRDRPDPVVVRDFLAARLPAYLVPSHVVVRDGLPLTGNGKVDRRALETVDLADGGGERRHVPPGTPTEVALAEIWREILSVDRLGVEDDFFDLGGQSFAALRVVGQIAQRLGRRVPLGALLERRTVAGLARWLDSAPADWSPLVRLTDPADAGAPPWVLVHPAGGDVLCYRDLAARLDRGCLALQAPGPAVGREPVADLGELARLYLAALRQEQPHGPYLLGGWSSGAVIAAELARQLAEAGEQVRHLVVIDSPAPVTPQRIDDAKIPLWFVEDLDRGFDPGLVTPEQLRELAALPAGERLDGAARLAAKQGVPVDDLTGGTLTATYAVFEAVVRAGAGYRAGRIDADVMVLRARDGRVSEFADHPYGDRPDWGWAELTGGRMTAVAVPGTHHTVLTAVGVEQVAVALNEATRT